MSHTSETIGFSKKTIIGYLPPGHSLLSKHFKKYAPNQNSKSEKFSFPSLKINYNFSKTLKKKKYTLIVSVLAIISVLLFSWLMQRYRLQRFQFNLTEISELSTQAQNLIQQNDANSARQKLTLSIDKLNSLQTTNKTQQDVLVDLRRTITQDLQKINGINFIEKPQLFLDFKTVIPNVDNLNISNISLVGNVMFVTEQQQHKIYRLDLKKHLIAEADGPTDQMDQISQILSTDQGPVFINHQKGLFTYQAGQGFTIINTQYIQDDLSQAASLTYFNQNLYLLNPRARQIRKYSFENNQILAPGQDWLQNTDIDLSNAASLAVDGDIYLTKHTGQILKLSNGQAVEFKTDIHPNIKTDTRIFTSPDHNYLYILEPTLYRLIVLDKTGQLITQFNSPQFDDLKSFYPDEAGNILYVLNGNKIYQIENYLPQID